MVIREVEFSDYSQIKKLHKKYNLKILNGGDWINFWQNNPLSKNEKNKYAIGWVLIKNQIIVGYLGNIVENYMFKNRILKVACSTSWLVEKKFKLESFGLINCFFKQKNIDVFITTTPNEVSKKIFARYGAKKIPLKYFNQNSFIVLNIKNFIKSYLTYKKFKFSRVFSPIIFVIFSLFLKKKINFWKKFKLDDKFVLHFQLEQIHQDFLKGYKLKNTKFIQSKSIDVLNWKLNYLTKPLIISYYDDKKIKGFAICCEKNNDKYLLKRLTILDLIVIDDDEKIYFSLINKCIKESYERGYSVIDMLGTNENKMQMFSKFKTFKRNIDNFTLYYYAPNKELSSFLDDNNLWDTSMLDGDYFLT